MYVIELTLWDYTNTPEMHFVPRDFPIAVPESPLCRSQKESRRAALRRVEPPGTSNQLRSRTPAPIFVPAPCSAGRQPVYRPLPFSVHICTLSILHDWHG